MRVPESDFEMGDFFLPTWNFSTGVVDTPLKSPEGLHLHIGAFAITLWEEAVRRLTDHLHALIDEFRGGLFMQTS